MSKLGKVVSAIATVVVLIVKLLDKEEDDTRTKYEFYESGQNGAGA